MKTPGAAIFLRSGLYAAAIAAFVAASAQCASAAEETFNVRAEDGLVLSGKFRSAKNEAAPFLVFLHGLGSTRDEWQPLAAAAEKRGWGSFAYDARGHGQSRDISGRRVSYDDPAFGANPAFWSKMTDDLVEVARSLSARKKIEKTGMVFIGASLGANVCVNAAEELLDVPAVVLLSPGLNYAGHSPEAAIRRWRRPILMVAAAPDDYAARSAEVLASRAADPKAFTLWILPSGTEHGAHGTQLFDGKIEQRILDWITQKTLSPTAGNKSLERRNPAAPPR